VVIAREFARPWRRAASLESGQDLLEAGLLAGLPTKAVQGYTYLREDEHPHDPGQRFSNPVPVIDVRPTLPRV
jgi:hypothetical protein